MIMILVFLLGLLFVRFVILPLWAKDLKKDLKADYEKWIKDFNKRHGEEP